MNNTITKEHQEAIDRLAGYIANYVGSQDWEDHVDNAACYVSAALGMDEQAVNKATRAKLGIK